MAPSTKFALKETGPILIGAALMLVFLSGLVWKEPPALFPVVCWAAILIWKYRSAARFFKAQESE